MLDKNWEKLIKQTKSGAVSFLEKQNVIVAPVVLHSYIEAYRVVVYALQNMRPRRVFDEEKFINDCLFVSEELHWQGRIQRIESVSKPFLINGIRLAKNLDLIPTPEDDKKEKIQDFINGELSVDKAAISKFIHDRAYQIDGKVSRRIRR